MAVTRAKKIEQVQKLGKELQNVSSLIVTTYSKLTVAQDYELRKTLRASGAKYKVVKNTLAERAAKGTKAEGVLKDLSRVISINQIQALATMPSKEEIYSKLLFLMNAPAQRLVTVMNAVGRDIAVVINQGGEKGKSRAD